jgi:hypothetical protein
MAKKGQFKKGATADSIRQRKYNSSEEQKTRRAQRNGARAVMEKAGAVRKGDGKDVDHKDMNTANKKRSNLRVQSKAVNRARNKPHLKSK